MREIVLTGTLRAIVLALLSACFVTVPARASGFIILPTYDTSIAGDPQSAAIEGAIQTAINQYESLITNSVTVNIYFEETTYPGAVGLSDDGGAYYGSFSTLYPQLVANNANPAAIAALGADPPAASTDIDIKAPDARALGFNTPGLCKLTTTGATQDDVNQICGGASGTAYDGIVGLNVGITYPPQSSSGNYGLVGTAEHEIDEILGLGSALENCKPGQPNQPPACASDATLTVGNDTANGHMAMEDLFRWSAPTGGTRTLSTNCTTPTSAYFSYGSSTGEIAAFNNLCNGADFGDWAGSSPDRVQDAFGTPGGDPRLGSAEIDALSAIGFNTVVPEPSTWTMAATAAILLAAALLRPAR